jgi:hypothetical protein
MRNSDAKVTARGGGTLRGRSVQLVAIIRPDAFQFREKGGHQIG